MLPGVGIEEGRDKAGFLSRQCVWVLNGSRAVDAALWTFMLLRMSLGSVRPVLFLGWLWYL